MHIHDCNVNQSILDRWVATELLTKGIMPHWWLSDSFGDCSFYTLVVHGGKGVWEEF